MRVYYDFHIHSALSPCADNDMTPNNIVNMALINELDAIAITDHNCAKNAHAAIAAAKGKGLIVLPGMEVETVEEVHVVCLFATMAACAAFEEAMSPYFSAAKNRPKIFGEQLIMDEDDNATGTVERMLVTATTIDLIKLHDLAKAMEGVAVCAHVDRSSMSVLSNLGFIPRELDTKYLEFSKDCEPESYMAKNKRLFGREFQILQSSDAHYLEDIGERRNFIEVDGSVTAEKIISALST